MRKQANVNEYYRKKENPVRRMTPIWKREGQELRRKRELLELSQTTIGTQIGASASLISKLELGHGVQRRELLTKAYQTALELFLRKKQEHLLMMNM